MKLFQYDEKHQQVHGELELGNLSEGEQTLVQKVVDFLDKQRITDRYKRLILGDRYTMEKYEDDDGERFIMFHGSPFDTYKHSV